MKSIEWLLDRSIFFSFDRSGFLRHQKRFDPHDLERSMRGQVCLVTGANSGLGYEVARGLAVRQGQVHLLCRNAERGAAAQQAISRETGNAEVHLWVVDLSSPASIRHFVRAFQGATRVDVLIHNAGLLPLERTLTEEGLELTVATHLVGPFLLTQLLRSRLGGARVVFVSSGGMYTKRLNLPVMLSNDGTYDGVEAYAMTKRGQVVLSEMLARQLTETAVNAMHPGWAATPGVERSLPRFWRWMRGRLRTSEEGADTALWLAVAERLEGETGQFWFDRTPVTTHLLPGTREKKQERRRLWEMCERYSQLDPEG